MVPRFIARLALVLSVAVLAGGCEHNPADPGNLASITVLRNPDTLAINTSAQFSAVGTDANGREVGIDPVWSVAAGGGTISATGVFLAGTVPGTFDGTVTATVGSIAGSASVTVIAGAPATITITPDPDTLAIGGTRQFTAVVVDAAGNVLTTPPTWTVANGGGTISATGLFTAGTTAGTFANTVTASLGVVSGTAAVTVTSGALASITVTPTPVTMAVAATQQFTAVGKDANGNVVPITPIWQVVAGGGTINGTGQFTAGNAAGSFANTVRACTTAFCGGASISGFATVTVSAGALASITVSPNPVSVGTDASMQFSAVGRDANNNIVPIVPALTWSVQPGNAGGTITSGSGDYTAPTLPGTGIDTVVATSGALSGTARVNIVLSGPLASIAVMPNPANVNEGANKQFRATGFDATGLIVPTPGLVWSVVPGMASAGTINSGSGQFTGGSVDGTFTNAVKATSGTVSGFATVVVNVGVNAPLVPLGAAAPNGIMAGQAVTCITGGLINADVSISPGNTLTGFGPCVITGVIHLADGVALAGQGDLTTAYNTLMGLPCPPANAIAADLGGTTIAPGVYCSAIGIGATGPVTLDGGGDPNANFVFQAGTSIVTAGDVILINGAKAKNVYWVSGSSVTLGTGSQWKGNIVALTSITLVDTANLIGRALARNGSVSLGTNNTITLP